LEPLLHGQDPTLPVLTEKPRSTALLQVAPPSLWCSVTHDEWSWEPLSYDPYAPRDVEPLEEEYSPVAHPLSVRELVRKLLAPLIALGVFLLKFGAFAVKFFGIFISVGGYALIWGWRFAAGFVLLILVHEVG